MDQMDDVSLTTLAEAYRLLEAELSSVVSAACAPWCSSCRELCCNLDICSEASESAWLCHVREETIDLDETRGWLGNAGCRLRVGRPPVCYEFYCNRVFDAFDSERRYALRVLSRILTNVGARALGSRHLVELNEDELSRVAPERIARRLPDAWTALRASTEVLDGGALTANRLEAMSKHLPRAASG